MQALARTRTRSSSDVNRNALTHKTALCQMSAMSLNTVFTKLTRVLKEKLPATIQKILIESSFDSEVSILGINSEIITEIEKFVNENKHILQNTEYEEVLKKDSVFKLKPGHRSVLSVLPKKLQDYNNNTKKIKKVQANDEETLKESLINKLLKFSEKHSFALIFDKTLIKNFRIEKNKPKCQIECPICNKHFTCYYTTYWHETNFQKHLTKHFAIEEVQNIESGQTTSETVFLFTSSDDIGAISD